MHHKTKQSVSAHQMDGLGVKKARWPALAAVAAVLLVIFGSLVNRGDQQQAATIWTRAAHDMEQLISPLRRPENQTANVRGGHAMALRVYGKEAQEAADREPWYFWRARQAHRAVASEYRKMAASLDSGSAD